jgi:hypothetical protein
MSCGMYLVDDCVILCVLGGGYGGGQLSYDNEPAVVGRLVELGDRPDD